MFDLIEQFALFEIYYIVARLVQEIRLMESQDNQEWMEQTALALTCKNGVIVNIRT
jgi:hypothetical protein